MGADEFALPAAAMAAAAVALPATRAFYAVSKMNLKFCMKVCSRLHGWAAVVLQVVYLDGPGRVIASLSMMLQVFDGHGGVTAAEFASQHLLEYTTEATSFPSHLSEALVRPSSSPGHICNTRQLQRGKLRVLVLLWQRQAASPRCA